VDDLGPARGVVLEVPPPGAGSWPALGELIGRKASVKGGEVIAVGVMPDHVHLFVEQEPKGSAWSVANRFTGYPSGVLREEFPHLRSRMPTLWSPLVFVVSVGAVGADAVRRCIDTQWERPWVKKEKEGPNAPRV
jgi:putative transposase